MSCSCSNFVLYGSCCCQPSECAIPEPSQGPQGIPGPTGPAGSNGTNGVNAFTFSTSGFTQPAIGNNVAVPVLDGTWAAVGQILFVQTAGFMKVIANGSTSLTLQNVGADDNASAGTNIGTNSQIVPAGYAGKLLDPLDIVDGGTGANNAITAFANLSPLTTAGDTLVYEGGANTRKAIGTSGQIPVSNGTVWNWGTNAPAAANITGQVAIANGGTGASTAATARTALGVPGITDNNTYTGNTTNWNLPSVTGILNVKDSTGTLTFLSIDAFGEFVFNVGGSGSSGIVCNTSQNYLNGKWTQPIKAFQTASASTFSFSSSTIETVVSTYSTTGAQSITLPTGTDGRVIRISDGAGNAATNNITISRSGSDSIIGATTYVMNANYQSVAFMFVSSIGKWVILP